MSKKRISVSGMDSLLLLGSFRRNVPTSEFNVAFAALIFLRWADFEEAEREAIAAFEDVDYKPKSVSRFGWRDLQNRPHELERMIRQLPQVVGDFATSRNQMVASAAHHAVMAIDKLSRLPVEVVSRMIEWLAHQPFETPADRRAIRDVLDEVLRSKTDRFSGEFFTPHHIAALMVDMVRPQHGESVYDPCFGSAGLLTTALDSAKQSRNAARGIPNGQPLRLSGVEINAEAFVIGITRLGLSGISDSHLEHGNSLTESERHQSNEGFDVVLANPPWGMKIDLHGLEDRYPIPTNDSSSLFLQHAISKLRTGGRCVMVVPPSLLFRGGREQQLREWLLHEHRVEAIVAMPKGAFSPHTSIETCVLLIRKGGSTRSVRMVDSNLFFKKAGVPGSKASLPEMTPELFASSLVEMLVRSPERYDRGSDEWWDVDVETLASIDYDLTPKRRDRSDLELILDSLPDQIKIVTLDDCCEISGGRAVRSDYLVNTDYLTLEEAAAFLGVDTDTVVELRSQGDIAGFRDGSTWKFSRKQLEKIARERGVDQRLDAMVPYVRIGDISNGVATRGSSFVAPTYLNQLKPEWRLQSGDLLLSKSGTIGKSGIVRDGAVGAIAANGFFILRAKEGTIDPHYLLAFLQSTEANAWLEDRARGAAAKHLSLSSIKDLPVALPPLQIQQRTAEQHRKFGVDALTYLAELLSEDASDPVAAELNEWVSRSLRQIEDGERAVHDLRPEGTLDLIEEIAQSPCPINRCQDCGKPYHLDFSDNHYAYPHDWAKGIDTTCLACWLDVDPGSDTVDSLSKFSPIVPWAIAFKDATSVLNRISNIPDPVGILNVLQSARTKLLSSLEKLKGHLPNEDKARQLTNKLWTLIGSLENRLLANVKIAIDVAHANELGNGETAIELNVRNKGSLPIRETSFSIKPRMTPDETATISYLPVDDHVVLIFRGEIPPSDETQTFVVGWKGRNLNGDSFEGSTELSVAIQRSVDEVGSPSDLGPSPYICGSEPVKRERDDVFFGRDELLGDGSQKGDHRGSRNGFFGSRKGDHLRFFNVVQFSFF